MRNKQRGVSYIGIFFFIILLVVLIKIIISLWPAFWDDRIINQQIETELADVKANINAERLQQNLANRMERNNIRNVKLDQIVSVSHNSMGIKVHKHYQVKKPFISNIEFLITFDKSFEQNF